MASDVTIRATQVAEDYGSGLLNRTTSWTYTLDDLIATLTATNATTGDQTTTYNYGTSTTSSGVARKDLLIETEYPDTNVVGYTYNRQRQVVNITDQNGNVRTQLYDKLGRLTDDCVTAVGSVIDTTVMRISTTYEVRGMIATVTSWDNPTPNAIVSGADVVNQCVRTYNSFGQLIKEQQSHSGACKFSTPSVQYGYDTGTSGSNEIRQTSMTYPNGRVVSYNYASGMDSYLNRVTSISDTSATLASYTYLGLGTVVRITYPQPEVWLDLWGGTSGTFNGLDQFNRIIDQRWQNDITTTPTDIDRYQYGYDQNSNRQYKANVVGTPIVTNGLDEYYTYDHLNRLTDMQRGTLNSSVPPTGITGTPTIEQTWSLDPTGNWSNFVTQASGTTNLNQTRTSNTVNEITNITGPTWIVPAYDAAGNMTTMPQVADPTQTFYAIYDAWNRLININTGDYLAPVGLYSYDGFNRRNHLITYSSGAPVGSRVYYYTANWQDIEERVGSSTSADKQYVWGIRYIDELVCRDDTTPERLYACQDANFNVTSITDATSGNVQERYLYDPYGNRTIMNGSWIVVSSSAFAWLIGFQGLTLDTETWLISNRERMLHFSLGIFLTRDWTGARYTDGSNLYQYLKSNIINLLDPSGRDARPAPLIPSQPEEDLDRGQLDNRMYPAGNMPDSVADSVDLGCIGLCSAYQGLGQNYPEDAPNTTCYNTESDAMTYSKCPSPSKKFIFAIQGDWSDPKGPKKSSNHTVPNNSINTHNTPHFNYVTKFGAQAYAYMNHQVFYDDFGMDDGSQRAYLVQRPPSTSQEYPNQIWCVTCIPCPTTAPSSTSKPAAGHSHAILPDGSVIDRSYPSR